MPTKNLQQIAIDCLEKHGYRCKYRFDACGNNGQNGQIALMVKKIPGISQLHCEVNPDGTINGQSVDKYLS